jgi:hypothetical protein
MSGSLTSTGMLTNKGNNFLDIQNDLDKTIDRIIIHNIPLSQNPFIITARTVGKLFTPLIHSAFTPTFSHIAIQLLIEDSDFNYIIEYGQYYSRDSNINNSSFNSSGSNEPRPSTNRHDYYYINEDGVRLTRISKEELTNELEKDVTFRFLRSFLQCRMDPNFKLRISNGLINLVTYEIAKEFYGEIEDKNVFKRLSNDFKTVKCDVKNKITLRELCINFRNEKWLAKKYNVASHNCQTFAAELITFLKAIRENEEDKIRLNEKELLPGCIIKALWNNEDLSLINTMGRIPIVGLIWDIGCKIRYAW